MTQRNFFHPKKNKKQETASKPIKKSPQDVYHLLDAPDAPDAPTPTPCYGQIPTAEQEVLHRKETCLVM